MKRMLIVGALALIAGVFAAGGLFAADLAYPRPLPQAPVAYLPPPPAYSWIGFYIGITAVAASATATFSIRSSAIREVSTSRAG
jgi:hypothetical protein